MTLSYDHLLDSLHRGRIGRREFLAGASALGIAVSLPRAVRAEPNQGGRFRIGMGHGSTTDTLDPATFENGYMLQLTYTIHNYLTEVDENDTLVPELAETWEASDDAAEWTFKLKDGLEFHNGKSVTADDVVVSFNHHRGEDSKSAAKPIVAPIKEIVKVDDRTVRFVLDGGNADFPYIVSDYHLPIMPAVDGKPDLSGIGCGPYVLDSFEPGVRGLFKKFPNYHKKNRAHFDEVEILSIIDVTARTNALSTGEIDVMDRCDLKTVHLLKRNPNVKVQETTGTRHYTFPMRTDTAPFDNANVRRALKWGLNREALVETVLRGHGVVGNDHPIAPTMRFHNGELEQTHYDPDKAKFYLKEAGLTNLTVNLSAADAAFAGAVDAATLYREHAAPAGIDINIVREPNDGYWSNVWMKKPWCACYWGGRPTEDWMFSTAYETGVAWNDTFWSNERFDTLLHEARSELDEARRRDMYYEMQAILRDDGGLVCSMFANYVFAHSSKIAHDEQMGSNWDLDGQKCVERWWFA
ncbi:MAG: ABC transporter substrate-binding protein [Geminicoccaceae bacterium]|nr:ABC transporter substrate-binding protein [Geminicoccaceae bacterium]MCB9943366.1 ABC transporter substrate-binding protein [Geminicoccaceae bacterium]